jgi:nucleoside-diphosphate-sugar epimerase
LARKAVGLSPNGLHPIHEEVPVGGRSSLVDRMRLSAELEKMVLDNSLGKRLLGWEPKIRLEEGLKKEFAWLQGNPDRWSRMSY